MVVLEGWRPRVTARADTVRSTTATSPDRWHGSVSDLSRPWYPTCVSDLSRPGIHAPSLVHRGLRVVEPGHQTFPTDRKSP